MSRPMVDKIWVETDGGVGFWQHMEFGEVPKYCSHCLWLVHGLLECHSRGVPVVVPPSRTVSSLEKTIGDRPSADPVSIVAAFARSPVVEDGGQGHPDHIGVQQKTAQSAQVQRIEAISPVHSSTASSLAQSTQKAQSGGIIQPHLISPIHYSFLAQMAQAQGNQSSTNNQPNTNSQEAQTSAAQTTQQIERARPTNTLVNLPTLTIVSNFPMANLASKEKQSMFNILAQVQKNGNCGLNTEMPISSIALVIKTVIEFRELVERLLDCYSEEKKNLIIVNLESHEEMSKNCMSF